MKSNKIISCIVALLLVVSLAVPAFAASESASTYPGETAVVYFSYDSVYSLDGSVSVSDPDGIVDSFVLGIEERDGMLGGQVSGDKCFMYDTSDPAVSHNVVLRVSVKLKADAAVGKSASVSFAYNKGTDATGMTVDSGTDTATVTVIVRPEDEPADPDQPGTPDAPTEPEVKIDYSELERQISIAAGLNQADYTSETWTVLAAALTNANDHLDSEDQDAVDAAAKQLGAAIAALIRMDYSALEAALESAKTLGEEQELGDLLTRLLEAMTNGKAQLSSNDQTAVDAAAAEINELLTLVRAALENLSKTEVVIQEVPVEVEPEGEFCNIPMHRIWLIIMIISLILNVALIAVIVVYLVKKKKKQKDNTPLVDYDIGDDE